MEKNNKRLLKVGQFHYVSEKQKLKSITNIGKNNGFNLDSEFYLNNQFSLPRRGTVKSSGYDLYSPFEFVLKPGETIFIPLGINVEIENGRWLMCIPRSGVGFKYRIRLDNTVGNMIMKLNTTIVFFKPYLCHSESPMTTNQFRKLEPEVSVQPG